jgi:LPXTG-site transpeptidase (sortase) family protein
MKKTKKLPPPAVSKEKIVALYRQALLADIPLETVDQKIQSMLTRVDTTWQHEQEQDQLRENALKTKVPFMTRMVSHVVPALFVLVGIFLVGSAVWPIVSYFVFTIPSLRASTLLTPIPQDQVLDPLSHVVPTVQADTLKNGETNTADQTNYDPVIVDTELDYINLANWFPNGSALKEGEKAGIEYVLDIPELDVHDAKVKLGGTNLDHNLIQYPGTAMPGEPGAPVIFGHSVLRQFYNPSEKNPRRYFSIFSKIMTLKTGDTISIKYDGVQYTYKVTSKRDVEPEDTYILEQRYDIKHLKLITCTPEGTTLHRGVVEAELVK